MVAVMWRSRAWCSIMVVISPPLYVPCRYLFFCYTCTKHCKVSSVETWMKKPLGRPAYIEIDPTKSGWQGMEWIKVTLDMDWWRYLVCDVVTFRMSGSWGNSRRTAVWYWVTWLVGCLGRRYCVARRTITVAYQICLLSLSLSLSLCLLWILNRNLETVPRRVSKAFTYPYKRTLKCTIQLVQRQVNQ